MGKFARTIARVHEYTTDYLVDGAKATGRVAKTKVLTPVGSKVSSAVQAVKAEHADIEAEREVKRQAKAKAKAIMDNAMNQAKAEVLAQQDRPEVTAS